VTSGLVIEELSVDYGPVHAVDRVSAVMNSRMITAVTGPNGAGKSSLMLAIRGTVPHSRGRIMLDGEDVSSMRPGRRCRAIAIVPQGRQLFPRMSVRENLQLMADLDRLPSKTVGDALDRFSVLRQREKKLAGVLSGGEQQMLAVARALMGDPRVLLLDEPMTGLAPIIVNELGRTMQALAQQGVIVVLAVPTVRVTRDIISRGYVLIRGHVGAESDSADQLDLDYQRLMGIEIGKVVAAERRLDLAAQPAGSFSDKDANEF
jgi:branched-chain amino acid transport system ATP-binding protein